MSRYQIRISGCQQIKEDTADIGVRAGHALPLQVCNILFCPDFEAEKTNILRI